MKFSYTIEDGYTTVRVDEADMYSPLSEKDRIITLAALTAEERRAEAYVTRERNTARKEIYSKYLSAVTELIAIYRSSREFRVTPMYKYILCKALECEKKHRKKARRISRDIQDVPHHENMEIGGVFDFSALYETRLL